MKIDLKQIAAGTALAGMTQAELAGAAGLDPASLSRILSGDVQPRPETMDRLKYVLEGRQVEFGSKSGVSLKDDYFERWEGQGVIVKMLDHILRVMIGTPGEVLFSMVDPALSPPDVRDANLRLHDAGIVCRYLCSEDNKVFDGPKEAYRAVPRKYFTNDVQIVYSDYVALNSSPDRVFIFNSQATAESERGKFNFIWDHCEPFDGTGRA